MRTATARIYGTGALLALWFALAAAADPAAASGGLRLLMVEEQGCRYCRLWDADVGGDGYRGSAEGQVAPLARVRRGAPEIKGFSPVVYTPTFILVRDGQEIGRITGYPGREWFWVELKELLAEAGMAPSPKRQGGEF